MYVHVYIQESTRQVFLNCCISTFCFVLPWSERHLPPWLLDGERAHRRCKPFCGSHTHTQAETRLGLLLMYLRHFEMWKFGASSRVFLQCRTLTCASFRRSFFSTCPVGCQPFLPLVLIFCYCVSRSVGEFNFEKKKIFINKHFSFVVHVWFTIIIIIIIIYM